MGAVAGYTVFAGETVLKTKDYFDIGHRVFFGSPPAWAAQESWNPDGRLGRDPPTLAWLSRGINF